MKRLQDVESSGFEKLFYFLVQSIHAQTVLSLTVALCAKQWRNNTYAWIVRDSTVLCNPQDAVRHVARIHRVLGLKRGNLMLVGVGGSGRQSLTRLAAYISGQELFTIEIAKNYRQASWWRRWVSSAEPVEFLSA